MLEDNDIIMADSEEKVDEALYSRQLYVMGHAAQKRLQSANVLIVGLRGLGVEIAKNVILAGVKSLSLLDNGLAEMADLGSQFYLKPEHVGKVSRADASIDQLTDLNKYVKVSVVKEELTETLLGSGKYQTVVLTDSTISNQMKFNDYCHKNGINFIAGDIRGVLGRVFVDFGDEFIVADATGERELRGLICNVTKANPGVVTCHDGTRHGLEDGQTVTFEEVQGMVELNSAKAQPVKVLNPYSFSIGDTSGFSEYENTKGYFNQVKQPVAKHFKTLKELNNKPPIVDNWMGDREQYHALMNAISEFQDANGGNLPKPDSKTDAAAVMSSAKSFAAGMGGVEIEEDDKVLLHMARCSSALLNPMAAYLGGIIGQEVLKACSGKFCPIEQFHYYHAKEALPSPDLDWSEYTPTNSRYDAQIAVFGKTVHAKITSMNYFLVGAGAIGCEMLKNWALMGMATDGEATIHLTDMDVIEKSNLNRQFLFRDSDVKQLKSECAAREAKKMNPAINVDARSMRVSPATQDVYDDDFWGALAGVCTALDNVEARLYVDQRCVYFRKPLVYSGTLGTKGNTQVVVPYLTESYGSSRDPPEEGIPICTLKNFPNKIEHTIQYARSAFEGYFKQGPEEVNSYLSEASYLSELSKQPNAEVQNLETILSFLVDHKPLSFEQCIEWARLQFELEFHNNILQLLNVFPEDSKDSNGVAFWSGPKRAPKALKFDMSDPTHMDFVVACANLRAFNFGLTGGQDPAKFAEVLAKQKVPAFVVNKAKKIAATEAEAKEMAENVEDDHDVKVKALSDRLPSPSTLAGYRLHSSEFEKDDDTNHHIAFITAFSNLRARNYGIKESSQHETKFIAGKIIPAIATTTALVTGLVCMELYKLAQEDKKLEHFQNSFVNLALPLFTQSEPTPPAFTPAKTKKNPEWKWSLWDRMDVDIGDCTLQELLDHFEEKYGLEINMLSYGASMLYYTFGKSKKAKERLKKKMSVVVQEVSKTTLDPQERYLQLEACVNETDGDYEDVDIPYIRFKFK